jgi:hypothetical protein
MQPTLIRVAITFSWTTTGAATVDPAPAVQFIVP